MRWRCSECNRVVEDESYFLRAPNPFDPLDEVMGCPHCKRVGEVSALCDELGCDAFVACGTPTDLGYRNTCYKHRPK